MADNTSGNFSFGLPASFNEEDEDDLRFSQMVDEAEIAQRKVDRVPKKNTICHKLAYERLERLGKLAKQTSECQRGEIQWYHLLKRKLQVMKNWASGWHDLC